MEGLDFVAKSESEVAQSCSTLCDPIDCSLPGSAVYGIFQAIVLEWIAVSFSRESSQPRAWTWVSCIVDRHFTIWATWEVHFFFFCGQVGIKLNSALMLSAVCPWASVFNSLSLKCVICKTGGQSVRTIKGFYERWHEMVQKYLASCLTLLRIWEIIAAIWFLLKAPALL